MADFDGICQAVRNGNRAQVLKLVDAAVAEKTRAGDILNKGLIAGIRLVGDLFKIVPALAAEVKKRKG